MASRRSERKHRQTYPGPNAADNQQMIQDIKDSIAPTESLTEREEEDEVAESGASGGHCISAGSDKEMKGERQPDRERPESRDLEQSKERRSPQSDREQASPGAAPRSQNRTTPTKQLTTDKNRQHLRDIRRTLRPFYRSDPGLAVGKEKVNRTMLEQLINLGHSEVSAWGSYNHLASYVACFLFVSAEFVNCCPRPPPSLVFFVWF